MRAYPSCFNVIKASHKKPSLTGQKSMGSRESKPAAKYSHMGIGIVQVFAFRIRCANRGVLGGLPVRNARTIRLDVITEQSFEFAPFY